MTTYNTKDPLGSASPKNLYDNSENLDKATNDREAEKWTDRFGSERLSWHGMEMRNERLIEKFNQDMLSAILAAGYSPVGSFQEGAIVNTRNETVLWALPEGDGDYYRWDGDLQKQVAAGSTPQSTGGVDKGAWVSVGDASLRSELATDGGKLIYINGKQSLDDYTSDMPSFERWGNADALDNTAALYTALAWMKTRGVGHLYFPRKYRMAETIPLETNIAYNGNGKSTSGFIITHNEDAFKIMSGKKYSPEINDLIIQHESLNSPSIGINGLNGQQFRLSNVQVNGFKTGVITGGESYYSNFDRVRAMNCDEGFVFESGSRGITASDCSADAKLCGFKFNAETDSINNINLLNAKAEKIRANGIGFSFNAVDGQSITGVSALSGRFDPESSENGQIFIKTQSEYEASISNILFIDPTVFNTEIVNMLVGEYAFEQVMLLGGVLGYGNIKGTGILVHDLSNLTRAGRVVFHDSATRPRFDFRNRQNTLYVGIRASNVEAMGVLNVNNQNSGREAGIAIAECTWEKPFKMGPLYLWVTSTGLTRRKLGVPGSEGDGVPCNW
ncbi:tail fiber/spike domain-containing protein [Providencia huashanensis]